MAPGGNLAAPNGSGLPPMGPGMAALGLRGTKHAPGARFTWTARGRCTRACTEERACMVARCAARVLAMRKRGAIASRAVVLRADPEHSIACFNAWLTCHMQGCVCNGRSRDLELGMPSFRVCHRAPLDFGPPALW